MSNDSFFLSFMLGGISGVIAKTICAPIERVKLIMQTQDTNPQIIKKYTGMSDCFVRVSKEEGFWALWRGNLANVIRYFPTQAFNFAFKDAYQKIFNPYDKRTDAGKWFLGNLMSGGAAGASSMVFVYPLDFARTRLGVDMGKAAEDRQFKGLLDCAFKIFKADGVTGLYRGFGVSVIGIFVYRAFYFGCYDSGKDLILTGNLKDSLIVKFFFAQLVVTSSESLSYPLDTVRRRMMMQSGKAIKEYTSAVDCFNKILKNEGPKAFFKGNFSNIVRSIGSSMVLVLYDEMKKYMNIAPKA
jgi:solute carrier family 25 (adenine nucleotide translocator) protein 4/5/6/31